MRKTHEIKAELEEITNEKERLQYFQNLITEFDKDDRNNDRKHFRSERRCDFDITNMDTDYDPDDSTTHIPEKLVDICKPKDWDEMIFTKTAEDMHELIADRSLNSIIKRQKTAQKEALFHRVIKGYSAEEISELTGVSDRCVRKNYAKALQHIREEIYPILKFKEKLIHDEKYSHIVQERNIRLNRSELKFLDEYKEVFQEKYMADRKPEDYISL